MYTKMYIYIIYYIYYTYAIVTIAHCNTLYGFGQLMVDKQAQVLQYMSSRDISWEFRNISQPGQKQK